MLAADRTRRTEKRPEAARDFVGATVRRPWIRRRPPPRRRSPSSRPAGIRFWPVPPFLIAFRTRCLVDLADLVEVGPGHAARVDGVEVVAARAGLRKSACPPRRVALGRLVLRLPDAALGLAAAGDHRRRNARRRAPGRSSTIAIGRARPPRGEIGLARAAPGRPRRRRRCTPIPSSMNGTRMKSTSIGAALYRRATRRARCALGAGGGAAGALPAAVGGEDVAERGQASSSEARCW